MIPAEKPHGAGVGGAVPDYRVSLAMQLLPKLTAGLTRDEQAVVTRPLAEGG
jgi:hypothetical protein